MAPRLLGTSRLCRTELSRGASPLHGGSHIKGCAVSQVETHGIADAAYARKMCALE